MIIYGGFISAPLGHVLTGEYSLGSMESEVLALARDHFLPQGMLRNAEGDK